ncbi:carbohydrate ABC transporter permease [Paenibacillus xerothermodurans]|uniref:Carbohydrate ABC transporter permease n=1 Tax=Paenibacillus xerothermodurans TaxID=1977292 RepID=A0A2W1N752_PAEXE|nr:carbohydrate ABC transporter permease [Paenibacillus xerothermodurans]PZE20439.1 carbohydrate ABC transporter permease [Paenibacillus xerothermodurans]
MQNNLGEKLFDVFNVTLLTVLTIATVYPFLYVAFASVSSPAELASYSGLLLFPLGAQWDAYKLVLSNPLILSGYKNTLIYVVVGTTLNVIVTALLAYGLSRKGVLLRNHIMLFIVFTMFFSGGLIPTYLLMKSMGLLNTIGAIVLPGLISTMNLIIMRTYFQSIPESLEESARLDGAGDWTILFRIIIPLAMPVISVMILYYGVGHWNAWFNASIYLNESEMYPLQLVLRNILINNKTDDMMVTLGVDEKGQDMSEVIKYATIMVATVPVLFAYPFLQKYFAKGVMIGAIKG